jgi:nucleoside-diphosphate-sugar epimerase
VVVAYRLALETRLDPASEAVFNLSSGQTRPIRSILDQLIKIGGTDVSVETDVSKLRSNDVPRTWGANMRAERELGWTRRVAFEQTLEDTLRAVRT